MQLHSFVFPDSTVCCHRWTAQVFDTRSSVTNLCTVHEAYLIWLITICMRLHSETNVSQKVSPINKRRQWRIQDFPDGREAPTYCFRFFPQKNCMKLKKTLDRECIGCASLMCPSSLDPLMSVKECFSLRYRRKNWMFRIMDEVFRNRCECGVNVNLWIWYCFVTAWIRTWTEWLRTENKHL